MTITVDKTPITLSEDFAEYISLMRKAVVKPEDPPVESDAEMIKKILLDNFEVNIKQHPSVRPAAIAEKIKLIELQANEVFTQAVAQAVS